MNFAVRNSTKFLDQLREYRLVNAQWTGMCVSGELVSLVVGSSVVKTWKWISLWNHIHSPSDSGRVRHLPWQPVRSDCKLTTSILFHNFFFHICTVHPAIIKVFYYQLMHKRIFLKEYYNLHFKCTLKRFLYHHSFYSMNEYYENQEDRRI